ncbi:MAG: PQQ-like beta-propeller repeat protein [Bacteroidia bacterium]|nr:PQQ-like beta-propeller repeat protein [Bacteroidia bacterium]
MKKRTKIILIILSIFLIVSAIIGYKGYQAVLGSEELTGNIESIPTDKIEIPPLTTGNADWPNWRGFNFDGKSSLKGINTDWSKGLKKLWQVDFLCQGNATASWATVVVQGNRLIVPGRDENNDLVFCLNSETGQLIWKGLYEAKTNTSHGPGARATAVIDSNRVYTFGRGGDVVCWQLLDGKILWKKNVMNEGGSEPQWGHSATPFVLEDKLIVQGGGKATVIAYDKITGKVLWKSIEGEAGYSAAMTITFDSVPKLLIYHGTGLSCLNPNDGKVLWTIPWATEYNVNATTPIVTGNLIFHTSGYGMGGELIEATEKGCKVIWKNNVIEAQHSDQILVDGYLYGYTGESNNRSPFKCVEYKTGKEMWSTNEIGGGTCIFVDNYIICLDLKGNLYLVKPDFNSFKKVGEMLNAIKDVKSLAWTSPVVANGKLYLRYMQTVICYNLME